jgi:hypothetical protein
MLFFIVGTEIWTQGFDLKKQVFYHLNHTYNPSTVLLKKKNRMNYIPSIVLGQTACFIHPLSSPKPELII